MFRRGDDTPPERGGVFAFLGNIIQSLQERFTDFVNKLQGREREFDKSGWVDIGRLVNEALPETFSRADQFLVSNYGDQYGGYAAATAFDEYAGFEVVFTPPGGEYEQRKTFADYLDVLAYLREVQHLNVVVVYDNGFYTLYIGGS